MKKRLGLFALLLSLMLAACGGNVPEPEPEEEEHIGVVVHSLNESQETPRFDAPVFKHEEPATPTVKVFENPFNNQNDDDSFEISNFAETHLGESSLSTEHETMEVETLVMDEPKRRPVSADTLDLIRTRYQVDHIIVGHTIFRNVCTFYDGRVIDVNVDNAVNRKKRRSRALLIENGVYYSVTDHGKRKRLPTE